MYLLLKIVKKIFRYNEMKKEELLSMLNFKANFE